MPKKKVNYDETREKQNISPTRPDEGKTWSDEIDQTTGKPVVEEQPGYVSTTKDVEGKTGFVILFGVFGYEDQKKIKQKNLEGHIEDLQKENLIDSDRISQLYKQFLEGKTKLKTGNMTVDLGEYEDTE